MYFSYHSFFNKFRGILIIMVWILILFIFPLILFSTGYESDQAKGRNQTSATFESPRLSANQSGDETNETPKNRMRRQRIELMRRQRIELMRRQRMKGTSYPSMEDR